MESTRDLIEDCDKRVADQQGRISAYKKFAAAYFSDSPDTDDGLGVQGMFGDGRAALIMRNITEDLDNRGGAPKLIKAMIDDIVSVRGVLPNMNVIAQDATPEAEKLAVKQTRAVRQWWRNSKMVLKQPRAAWSNACKGDLLYVLNPRFPKEAAEAKDPFKPEGIYIDVISPDVAYPRMKVGEDSDQIDDLYIVTMISKHAAKQLYGYHTDEPKVRVIVYYDSMCRRTIVGDREIVEQMVMHNLGFVPAEWHQNKPTDGRSAQADINDCIELEKTMQRQWHVFGDALLWSTYPMAVVKDPKNVAGDVLEYGPGAKVEVTATGDFTLVAPATNPSAAQMIFEASKEAIMQQAGVSPMRIQGSENKSNVTGRAVAAQMSPQEARLGAANERLAGTLMMLNSKMMLMFYKLEGFKGSTLTLDAMPKDGQGKDTITPEEFGGWIANTVAWDSALHLNAHERLAMALQLNKVGLFSGKRVLEYIGEEDPERTLRDGRADQEHQMQLMAQAQGGGQPPPGGAPPGGPQGGPPGGDPTAMAKQGMSLAAGGDPNQPPPGGPPGAEQGAPVQPPPGGAPPPQAQLSGFEPLPSQPGGAIGTPGPIDNPVPKVQAALDSIQGQMFGEVTQRYPIPGGFRVMLSDHRDVALVKATLRTALGPGVQLDVRSVKAPASSNGRSH